VISLSVSDLPAATGGMSPRFYDGESYAGGFGETYLYSLDLPTLRARSHMLFRDNMYAQSLMKRWVGNNIHTGLELECMPEPGVLDLDEQELEDWAEDAETRFKLYGSQPALFDVRGLRTFGEVQREAAFEAGIDGDCLVMARRSHRTGLPGYD